MRKPLTIAALTAATLIGGATAASAYTIDGNGNGFIGKGEVQSAFNLTNAKMQTAIGIDGKGVTFTSTQAAAQNVLQDVKQDVSRTDTQTLSWDLSCTVNGKNKTFHRDGTREGVATGTATGTQTGTQTGSLSGVLNASINAEARKTGQWTGWNVKGFAPGDPKFVGSGDPVLNAPMFTDVQIGAPVLGETVWGDWIAEAGENPADCLRNNDDPGQPIVTDLVNDQAVVTTTEGDVVPTGEVSKVGDAKYGTPYSTGVLKVSATISSLGTKPLALPAL